jgi:hypothetical protein
MPQCWELGKKKIKLTEIVAVAKKTFVAVFLAEMLRKVMIGSS